MQQVESRGAQAGGLLALGDALVLADQHRGAGRLAEASALCRAILDIHRDEPNATHLLGLIAHQSGRLGEAITYLRQAVTVAPEVPLYHANLGEMYRLAGQIENAVAHGRRAVALKADYPEALSNLGAALYEQKVFAEAADCHRRAIACNPGFARAHSNLGNALHAMKRYDEAIASYRGAVALEPGFADAWSNLGTSLHHAGRYDEGMAALRRAVALDPHQANAHAGLGILLLMHGDFAEGWDEYEWRLRSSEVKGPRFPQRPWQGESLAGRSIYVQAEQGFGDTLQFARYLPLLAARGAATSVRVHQQVATLLRASLPGIEVLGDRGDPARPPDCECALLSLPRLFRTRRESIPATIPYLRVPPDAARRWRPKLSALRGLRVGIVWAGNSAHANDFRRSLDLTMLAPLFTIPDIAWTSLQVGPRAADLERLAPGTVVDLSAAFTDFADTAAVVEALDLVLTVDTSVAHLAGGLGKPTFLLLPLVTDWRWMLGREDSPWYPSMRLFRQRAGEDWPAVIGRLATELAAIAAGDAARLTPFKAEGERRAADAAAIIAAESAHGNAQPHPGPVPPGPAAPPPGLTAAQALMLAEQHRLAGYLGNAEELCRAALGAEPENAEALHLLGIVSHQSGRLDEAITHIKRAVERAPQLPLYHANLGEMCRLAGRVEEAIAHGRRAVALKPDYPEALSNLGIALYEGARYDEALACQERALALRPDYAEAHSNSGNALRALGRRDEAEGAYRRALALRPAFAAGWNNLGTTLRDLKRPQEAEEAYRQALALTPSDPETLDNLALALKDLNRPDEAIGLLRQALSIEARSAKIYLHLGSLLIEQKQVEEATAAAQAALALDRDNHDTLNLMGRIAFERGALDEALALHQRALALNPDLADACNNMGNVLKELGRLDEARAAYRRALVLDPAMSGTYVNLADAMTFAPDEPLLAAMETLAGRQDLASTDRMQLHFALGKAYGDLAQHQVSFAHLLQGNALKRAMTGYDEAAALGLFDRIEAVFTAERVAGMAGRGDDAQTPILVLGMPRSGTTLVEQILASHPRVHGAGELDAFDAVVRTVHGPDGKIVPYPEFVPALDATALRAIGARYVERLRALAPEAPHVTDKMPSNFYFVGLIHVALPRARIIHVMRDPVDTCVSCFSKLFSAAQDHTYDLAELGRYYARYARLMAHWRRVLPPNRMLEVRYEDVVADLNGEARRIIAHCGLDWDPRCLAFHRTERPIRTASATQVRQPIYRSAVGRWRAYAPDLGPLLAELGAAQAAARIAGSEQS